MRVHTPHRSFSQCTTSFLGNWRLGIPRTPFVAYPTCDTEKLMFLRFPLAYPLVKVPGVRTPWLTAKSPLRSPTSCPLVLVVANWCLFLVVGAQFSVIGRQCSVQRSRATALSVVGDWCPMISFQLTTDCSPHGDEGTRTPDFLLAKQALSRLSYVPSAC